MVFLGRVKGTAVKKATDNPFHTILYRVSLFIRIPFKAVSICGDDMQKQITICDYLLFFPRYEAGAFKYRACPLLGHSSRIVSLLFSRTPAREKICYFLKTNVDTMSLDAILMDVFLVQDK